MIVQPLELLCCATLKIINAGMARIDDREINHPRPSAQAGNTISSYFVGLKSIHVKIKIAWWKKKRAMTNLDALIKSLGLVNQYLSTIWTIKHFYFIAKTQQHPKPVLNNLHIDWFKENRSQFWKSLVLKMSQCLAMVGYTKWFYIKQRL